MSHPSESRALLPQSWDLLETRASEEALDRSDELQAIGLGVPDLPGQASNGFRAERALQRMCFCSRMLARHAQMELHLGEESMHEQWSNGAISLFLDAKCSVDAE